LGQHLGQIDGEFYRGCDERRPKPCLPGSGPSTSYSPRSARPSTPSGCQCIVILAALLHR
jgi:hypothetical protein